MKEGFFIINKPEGMTSFDVIRTLRRILGVKKIGHGGTLDKLASGVLVVGVGNFTKKLSGIIGSDKEYLAEIKLGALSETYDREGPIHEVKNWRGKETRLAIAQLSLVELEECCKSFVGEIEQMPPSYSAKKIKGRRASDMVREGLEVKLEPKKVRIYDLKILDYDPHQRLFKIFVKCSSGTYIRSLAHDIGQKFGCGAYLHNLVRIKVGDFSIEQAQELDEILEK